MIYYDWNRQATSNGTAGTEDKFAAMRTVANQRTALITGVYLTARNAGAGGLILRLYTRPTTANAAGTGITPNPRDPDSKAADTVVVANDFTDGTGTLAERQTVGTASQGGFGAWVSIVPEQAITLKPNGGIKGNLEIKNICGAASVNFDAQVEFAEA